MRSSAKPRPPLPTRPRVPPAEATSSSTGAAAPSSPRVLASTDPRRGRARLVFAVVGGVALWLALTLADEVRFTRDAVRQPATLAHVVVVEKRRLVSVVLADGQRLQTEMGMLSDLWLPEVGQGLAVWVHPTHPDGFRVDSRLGRHAGSVALLLGLALLASGALMGAWSSRVRGRRRPRT